ncbi:hypothetical protein FDZ71_00220 [bacterium]|nr:MAG: hypothetical protein FDZ71_00220 [bacterium]
MRRLLQLSPVLAVFIATLLLVACQRAATPADPYLEKASAHVERYNQGYLVAHEALGVAGQDTSPAGWLKAADAITRAEQSMPDRSAALLAARAEWGKIATVSAPPDLKRYASLMSEVVTIKAEEESKTAELLAGFKQFCKYCGEDGATQSGKQELAARVQQLDAEATEISSRIYAKQKEAAGLCDDYEFFRTWTEDPAEY